MDETQKNNPGRLERLALLTDEIKDIFPNGDTIVVFELDKDDYSKMINHFREIDRHHKQFTIEISGVDYHFMLREEK